MVLLAKTPDVLKNDIEKLINPLNQTGLGSAKSAQTILEEVALRAAAAGVLSKISDKPTKTVNDFIDDIKYGIGVSSRLDVDLENITNIESFKDFVNTYGFNFYNKWETVFENKNLSSSDNDILGKYINEFTDPTYEFVESDLNIRFRKQTAIQDINRKEFNVSFYVDNKMYIQKIFLNLMNKMKNFKTGLIGYKENYKFDKITTIIYNMQGNQALKYEFYDCIFKNVGDIALVQEKSSIKNFTVTFNYDLIKVYDEKDNIIE